jgi:hypothetical protein
MSEWYADVKPSGKPYVPDASTQAEPDPMLMDDVAEGEIPVSEIASLSRPGYSRSFGGMHFADEDKSHVGAPSGLAHKPNNVTVSGTRRRCRSCARGAAARGRGRARC